jgi:hypothetical protein
VAVALLGTGVLAILGAIVLLSSGGDGDTGSPTPSAAVSAADRQAIEALARRSIEVLPAGEWPSLYEDFTTAFRDRCPRAEFDQAGVTAAQDLGGDLPSLAFRRLEELAVTGPAATAVIVGEVRGTSEYRIAAAFEVTEGAWKLAPAAGTEGCSAFNRISG